MSKELEYEVNNFANLLNKDCMNLMECLKKQGEDNKPILYLGKHYKKVILPYEEYQKMYKRLEAIDNANPSEALECLEKLKGMEISSMPFSDEYGTQEVDLNDIRKVGSQLNTDFREYTATIKQALLKAQEPKHYLKWEDLEFKEDNEAKIKVRMGEHIYDLWYGSYKTGYGTFKQKCSLAGYEFDEDYDIDFFNDLHLERVEE